VLPLDTDTRKILAKDRFVTLRRDYRSDRNSGSDASTRTAPQLWGSPSQQPSLKRQLGHCQVP
jgi:hypothetical protein